MTNDLPDLTLVQSLTETDASDEKAPLRVLVFDTQSTCAQIFSKQLSNHLRLGRILHPYVLAATLGPERIHTKLGNEHTKRLWQQRAAVAPRKVSSITYQDATNRLLRDAVKLEAQGKTLFVTEFAPFVMRHDLMLASLQGRETRTSKVSNPTVISDELLNLFTPLIFIQHPAVVIPGWARLAKSEYGEYGIDEDDFTLWTSLRWSRILFDHLRGATRPVRRDSVQSARSSFEDRRTISTTPYVIDAADVAANPEATLSIILRLLDIEADDSWTSYFGRAAEALKKAIPKSILKSFSSALFSPKAEVVDIDAEMVRWQGEFGEEGAQALRQQVDADLPHYNYLKAFKLQVSPNFTATSLVQNITGAPERSQSTVPTPDEIKSDMPGIARHPSTIIRSAIRAGPRERAFSI